MVRRLILVAPMLAATLAACTPAEPPLLIDGGQPPATTIGQQAPSGEPANATSANQPVSR